MKRKLNLVVVMLTALLVAFVCMGCAYRSVKPTDFGCSWRQISQGIQEGHDPDKEKCKVVNGKVVWVKKGGLCDRRPNSCKF